MEVELDGDPLQFGPKRLNGKIATARGMLTECERIYLHVSQLLQNFKTSHRTLELEFDIDKKHLYANDPEVMAGRNVADRDAIATGKLLEQARELNNLAKSLSNLEAVLSVVKSKRADLKDLQGRIRDQIKLCHEEIGLGAKWGSKPPPGTEVPDLDNTPKVPKQTIRDLQDLFSGSKAPEVTDSEVIAPDPQESAEESTPAPNDSEEEFAGDKSDEVMDSFLDAIKDHSNGTKSASPDSIESILESMNL
jgi:hypothetical protein